MEKTRFWRILFLQLRPSWMALLSLRRSLSMRETSAVSMATTVPVAPMARPRSACARAGASFTPSPTMATTFFPPSFSCSTSSILSSGKSSACTVMTLVWSCTPCAACELSPVSITVLMPMPWSKATASAASSRTESDAQNTATHTPSTPIQPTVPPVAVQAGGMVASSVGQPKRSAMRRLPTITELAPTAAATPSPGRVSNSSTGASCGATPSLVAAWQMAVAMGCVDSRSMLRRSCITDARVHPASGTSSVNVNLPVVSVPVLSMQSVRTAASVSRKTPPLTSRPWEAAKASPHTYVTGVEMTMAQGHATTSSTSAILKCSSPARAPHSQGSDASSAAPNTTAGV
mmetsp:Transcript_15472/g.29787  ORF Transcript_15472/g.29787 Transcript_15472/m.29787 type:complete len:347 (+) Transcript_15472:593-1633(+)